MLMTQNHKQIFLNQEWKRLENNLINQDKTFLTQNKKNGRNLYEIENEKNLFASKIKEIERNLLELEENLSKPKKYYDYDDTEYKGKRNVKGLCDLSIDEDYYKPIKTKVLLIITIFNMKVKNLSIKKYLDIIRPYLSDIMNYCKTHGKWRIHSFNKIIERKTQNEGKIQLTMAINFISSKHSDETCTMHAKSNNVEITMGNETNEITEHLFKSFLQKHQEGLEESMRGSEFIFDSFDALYYYLNKIRLSRGGSYIDSPKWLKDKKATINPKNNHDKCFQYALTVALNYEQIKKKSSKNIKN